MEVHTTQAENTARVLGESFGVDARTYLRYFMLGLLVYTVLFCVVVGPVDTLQDYVSTELGR